MKKSSAKNREKKISEINSFNNKGISSIMRKVKLEEEDVPSITDLSEDSLKRFIGCGS